jgi:hypothetical protein
MRALTFYVALLRAFTGGRDGNWTVWRMSLRRLHVRAAPPPI